MGGGAAGDGTEELLRFRIADEEGVFTVRRAGRRVAAAVGLDHQDQVRVATALSEAGRELFACSGSVSVAFVLDRGPHPGLVIELDLVPQASMDRAAQCQATIARLLSLVEQKGTDEGVRVRLRKDLPPGAGPFGDAELDDLRARLGPRRRSPART